jgi:1-phosphofructokinase family hexose kinase
MLLTITPNPCLERIIPLPDLPHGETVRVASSDVREVAGGKGLNAARVASACGVPSIASGWFGRDRAAWFGAQMEACGVELSPVELNFPTRLATQYHHPDGRVTQAIENGHALSLSDGTALLQKADELLPRAKMMLLGGSYPPASDERFALHASLLCGASKRHGVPVLYDGNGQAWEIALRRSPPWCVAPNADEAATLLRRPLPNEAAERRAIETILKWGVEVVLLTCGERGAYLGTRAQTIFLSSPRVEATSPVGCGDALAGAFAAKYLQIENAPNEFARLRDALRFGIAAGAAQAKSAAPGAFSVADVEDLLPQVRLQQHLLSLSPR